MAVRLSAGSNGPPALEHLAAYADGRTRGLPGLVGVEDFSADMLRRIGSALPVATAQQEINAIVRPSAATLAACRELGCRFVAYGPLLGGLLSDAYLGVPRPTPDADHTKQWVYLASIDAWADWQSFQRLLQVMRGVGEVHGGLPIATARAGTVPQLEACGPPSSAMLGWPERRSTPDAAGTIGVTAATSSFDPEPRDACDGASCSDQILDGLARPMLAPSCQRSRQARRDNMLLTRTNMFGGDQIPGESSTSARSKDHSCFVHQA